MKLLSYRHGENETYGVQTDDGVCDIGRRLGGYFDSTNCNTPAGYLEAQKEPGSRHHSGHRLLGTSAVSYRNRRRHLNTRFAGISGFHDRKGSAWGRSYSHEWQNSAVHQR